MLRRGWGTGGAFLILFLWDPRRSPALQERLNGYFDCLKAIARAFQITCVERGSVVTGFAAERFQHGIVVLKRAELWISLDLRSPAEMMLAATSAF